MKLTFRFKGGLGSGHPGHAGRPGKVGGSLPGTGGAKGAKPVEWKKRGKGYSATVYHSGDEIKGRVRRSTYGWDWNVRVLNTEGSSYRELAKKGFHIKRDVAMRQATDYMESVKR